MRAFFLLFITSFFLLAGQATGLREIKEGDKLPAKESLGVFKAKGNKLILYIKSGDIKSIAFFKNLAGLLKGKKDLALYVVDANPADGTDKRFSSVYDGLKIEKSLLPDEERKIYGDLGVIVIPTLMLVSGDNTLHSVIAGSRPNLNMFFKSYLDALIKGEPPVNVYEEADRQRKEDKIRKMLNQGNLFLLNGNFEPANLLYRKALEAAPENEEAKLGVGYSLLFMDKIDEALDYFTVLKEKEENNRVLLGYHLCRAIKQTPEAEESLEQAARLSMLENRYFFIIFKAAGVLDKAGKCEESKVAYRRGYEVLLRHYRRNK